MQDAKWRKSAENNEVKCLKSGKADREVEEMKVVDRQEERELKP